MSKVSVFVLLLIITYISGDDINNNTDEISRSVKSYFRKSQMLNGGLFYPLKVKTPSLFRRDYNKEGNKDKTVCKLCSSVVAELLDLWRSGATQDDLESALIDICVDLEIESRPICEGVVKLNTGIVLKIIDKKPDLTKQRVCAIVLQSFGCRSSDLKEWTINIPAGNSIAPSRDYYDDDYGDYYYYYYYENEHNPLIVLQLSDFHYDPFYVAGGNAECGQPLCCQKNQGRPQSREDACGYWSDYRNGDTPLWLITHTLKHIKRKHRELDYIYFTGDIISHKVWDTSVDQNRRDITLIINELRSNLPNVPIYPILGNHEPHPVNVYIPYGKSTLSTQWLFDLVADEWQKWLPKETKETIRHGGYYTVLVRPGFRIIALNSNVCYVFNWWLLYDDVDPFGQLQWLVDTLLKAEQNKERVHILSHVPSGDDTCLKSWSKQYRRIIQRFAYTIAAQFNGHTHNDEFVVYYNQTNQKMPINVAFNGGSLTPYTNLNPNYKIYEIDSGTLEVLDIDTYTYNITNANLNPHRSPDWYKLYSFKDAYDIDGMTPKDLNGLVNSFAKNRDMLKKYYKHFVRNADPSMKKGCDDACYIQNLCRIVTSEFEDMDKCKDLV